MIDTVTFKQVVHADSERAQRLVSPTPVPVVNLLSDADSDSAGRSSRKSLTTMPLRRLPNTTTRQRRHRSRSRSPRRRLRLRSVASIMNQTERLERHSGVRSMSVMTVHSTDVRLTSVARPGPFLQRQAAAAKHRLRSSSQA
eukprot:6926703-Karenia_brevis.AAC.1